MAREWMLKRNCSLSPAQVARVYGTLCAIVLLIGLAFALLGAWLMLVFALLEIAGVACALLHYARHASDRERIALSEGCLLIERSEGGKLRQMRLDPYWLRIALPDRQRTLIGLESRGVQVDVGCFISREERDKVARDLQRHLQAAMAPCH